MNAWERTLADYRGTGMTVGPHLLAHLRPALEKDGVLPAQRLASLANGEWVRVAGVVIVRQRPGTAKGFCFLTLEDETGLANVVLTPQCFERHRSLVHTTPLLFVEGPLQNVEGVIHVRARRLLPLTLPDTNLRQRGRGYRPRLVPEG
jgi:error-prone DNA polymerase